MSDGFIDGKCTHYIGKSINFTSDEPVTGGNWTQFLTHNSGKVNRFVEGNQTESTMDRKQSITGTEASQAGQKQAGSTTRALQQPGRECVRKLHERGQQVLSCFLCIKNNSKKNVKITLCSFSMPY